MTKQDVIKKDEEFFDDLATRWDELYKNEYFYRDRIYVLHEWLKTMEKMKQRKDAVALDIGCGSGQMINAYGREGVKAVGIDISEVMIKKALEKGYKQVLKFDGVHIPFEENYFDLSNMFNVIEFVQQPEMLLHEIFRVLKKDGYFLMTITNYNNIFSVIAELKHRLFNKQLPEHPQLKRRYNFSEIKKMLERAGFSSVKIYKYGISQVITAEEYHWSYKMTRNLFLGNSIYVKARKEYKR